MTPSVGSGETVLGAASLWGLLYQRVRVLTFPPAEGKLLNEVNVGVFYKNVLDSRGTYTIASRGLGPLFRHA